MPSQTLDFKCVIITGGGGGIGLAMAEKLLSLGKKVIIAGRTESKLQKASSEKLQNCPFYTLDTGDISSIGGFVDKLVREHPELDSLINNAGVQRPLDIVKMSGDDFLEKADNEININQRGPMHLAMRLLPHFQKKPYACIMNVGSVLGYIPFSIINPVYNATKAWVHFWSMNLRTQLAQNDATKHIRIVEIAPPTVATDLHREREDPDDNKKEKNSSALSVDEFMKEVTEAWERGDDTVGAGMSKKVVERWYGEFSADYEKAASK